MNPFSLEGEGSLRSRSDEGLGTVDGVPARRLAA